MISRNALKYLRRTSAHVDFWASARFSRGSSIENFVTVPKSWWRRILSIFNFVAHVSYCIFCTVRYTQYSFLQGYEAEEQIKVFTELCLIAHLVPVVCIHFCVLFREEQVATFINQYISYYRSITTGAPLYRI